MAETAIDFSDSDKEQIWEKIRSILKNRRNPPKLKTLLNEWEENYGPQCNDLAMELVGHNTRNAWANIAEEEQNNTIEGLIGLLWENFRQAGGEFTLEIKEDGTQIYCTKCPIADNYKEIGKPEYGLIFHCSTDLFICQGFNPAIKFQRSKTLMEGDDCCDHFYSMED
ncbi:MAG: L-2-amino-thiazoline-4-carboxylic acid hydrolase [Candidatus Heimdallarchaeota archaeon]